jgi:hypothetical protein
VNFLLLKSITFSTISSIFHASIKFTFHDTTSGIAATCVVIIFCSNAETSATANQNHSTKDGIITKSANKI